MNPQLEHLERLVTALRENLALCLPGNERQEPSVDAIHDVRTGTRRIEAQLDAMLRDTRDENLASAIAGWQRLLKKLRRAAAPARDLDVQRKILEKLVKREAGEETAEEAATAAQADDLDAWLRHARTERSGKLQKRAGKWSEEIAECWRAVQTAAAQASPRASRKDSSRESKAQRAARVALEAFARLSLEMQQLYAENLHDFRKGAKKARYMAESGGEDEYSGAVGKALKKLQDEIGDWHDWLVLADEAASVLGEQGRELVAKIESERDRRYALALAAAERMRGQLMGEWQAVSPGKRVAKKRVAETRVAGALPIPSGSG